MFLIHKLKSRFTNIFINSSRSFQDDLSIFFSQKPLSFYCFWEITFRLKKYQILFPFAKAGYLSKSFPGALLYFFLFLKLYLYPLF